MVESQKATRATIAIGSLEVEGFMLPDGSYRLSQEQIAEAVEKDESNARKFLASKAIKGLLGETYTPGKRGNISVESNPAKRGGTRIKPFTTREVAAFWVWEAFRGNRKALSLAMALLEESLDRRLDNAFGIQRSEEEYNERLEQENQELKRRLAEVGEGLALLDDERRDVAMLERQIRELGGKPYWELDFETEGG